MRVLLAAALMCVLVAAHAADGTPVLAPVADGTLQSLFGGTVETRLDADFNADGVVDAAAVIRDEEHDGRSLQVLIGYADDGGMGHDPIDGVAMDPFPLAPAVLALKNGVLVVEDLTGGTSAIASTYRYRYDRSGHRMRLIGDDVTYYSRTNNHDALEISTNRLTGKRIRREMKLNVDPAPGDDAAYLPQPESLETVDKAPIWMADAPSPDVTLGLGSE